MKYQDKFDNSLKQLDLQGIILLQGLLSQRAIELMMQPKEDEKKSSILLPEKAKIAL
jgi:hypothetical protein